MAIAVTQQIVTKWVRWCIAVPIGAVAGAVAFLVALGGVHLYTADLIQWLMLFPAALLGSLAIPAHLSQWSIYAFLAVSAVRMPKARPYLTMLGILLGAHVALGLVAFHLLH